MIFFSRRDPGKKGIPGGNPARIHDGNFLPAGTFSYRRVLSGIPVVTGFLAGSRQDSGGYFTRASIKFNCFPVLLF